MTKISELRSENIHKIRECFYDGEIWTKNKLAKQTGLSLAAITNILQLLQKEDEIKQIEEAESTGGRKSKQYLLNSDYYHLGIVILKRDDLHYYFVLQSYNLLGNCLSEKKVLSNKGTVEELFLAIERLVTDDTKIKLLSLSIPGVCQKGKISICDFERFINLDLANLIKEQYNLEIIMENDVNAASIGFAKRYQDTNNLVLMYQPKVKYIGCGIIINKQLYSGYTNFAGELSYLPFLSHLQQDELLKTNPNDLLMKQLVTICCVLNPELIGICSDVLERFDANDLSNYLAFIHQPRIIMVNDLKQLISEGLFNLGLSRMKDKIKRGNI